MRTKRRPTPHRAAARALLVGVVALVLVLIGVLPSFALPAKCWQASGYVRDAFSRPIQGASVWVRNGCSGGSATVYTDGSGKYTIGLLGDTLGAKDTSGQASKQPTYYYSPGTISAGVHATPGGNDFTLKFVLELTLSPSKVKPGQAISIVAETTAPPPSETPGARVVAQVDNGPRMNLTQESSDSLGWQRWTGSYTPPVTAIDGVHTMKVCGVDKAFTGNCDAAYTLGPPEIVTSFVTQWFWVDDTPPVITAQNPIPGRDTLDLRPIIAVSVNDGDGSGVDPSSLSLKLDGQTVPASYNASTGVLSFKPASNLALGLHTATATASDLAGNVAQPYSFTFDVVSLGVSPTTASIPAITVKVNPNGSAVPPSKVTFTAPPLKREPFEATLSSSLEVGYGTLDSVASLGAATVTFVNETGIAKTVSAGLTSATVSDNITNLVSTRGKIGVRVADRTKSLPNVTVNVPAGYGTKGSTATLKLDSVGVTPGPYVWPTPLGTDIPEQPWQIVGWGLTARAVQTNGSTDVSAGTYPIVRMRCRPGANCPVILEAAVLGSNQTAPPYGQDLPPELDPAGNGTVNGCAAGYSCVQVNGAQPTATFWSVPGIVASAGYHRLYSIAPSGGAPSRYVAWQQSYIDLNTVSCGSLLLQNFGNTTRSLTSAWAPNSTGPGFAATTGSNGQEFTDSDPGPEVWERNYYLGSPLQHRGKEVVYLARPEYRIGSRATIAGDPAAGVEPQLSQRADGVFVLTGDFTGAAGSRIDELGQIVGEPRGSYNQWTARTAGYDRSAVIHSGTEFVGNTNNYTFESGVAFSLLLDTTGC